MREVSFLNRLKELRQKNNLTLKQLGQKLNMLDSTLSQYETGKRNPKTEVWQKIADFFDVPVSYLRGIDADEIIEQVDFNKLSPLGLSFYEKENSNKDESLEATEIQLHEDMLNASLLRGMHTKQITNTVVFCDCIIFYFHHFQLSWCF